MHLRRILSPTVPILVVLLLTGCATFLPIEPETTEVDLVSNGMIVVSAQEQETSEGKMSLGSTFYFRNLATSVGGQIITAHTFTEVKNDFTHLEKTQGSINAHLLPPGEYELRSWELRASLGRIYRTTWQPRRASFIVKAGVIQYIGNIDMVLDTSYNLLGKGYISGGRPTIRDQYDRDIAIAKGKYPFLKGKDIKKQIMKYE
jgi:hypothetical protein